MWLLQTDKELECVLRLTIGIHNIEDGWRLIHKVSHVNIHYTYAWLAVHICVWLSLHICMIIHICMKLSAHICVIICTYMCYYLYTCVWLSIHICMTCDYLYTYVLLSVHTCMCLSIHMCMIIFTHMHDYLSIHICVVTYTTHLLFLRLLRNLVGWVKWCSKNNSSTRNTTFYKNTAIINANTQYLKPLHSKLFLVSLNILKIWISSYFQSKP